jgi:hypothetical protein
MAAGREEVVVADRRTVRVNVLRLRSAVTIDLPRLLRLCCLLLARRCCERHTPSPRRSVRSVVFAQLLQR